MMITRPPLSLSRILPLLIALAVLFASCSGRVDGVIRANGSAELTLDASLEPRMASLIRSLSRAMGGDPAGTDEPVLDGPAIAASIAAAPGVSAAALRNRSSTAIGGTITIDRFEAFLSSPLAATPGVVPSASPNGTGGDTPLVRYDAAGKLIISLDRRTSPAILSRLSPEVNDYLSALLAPAATGEALSRTDYLNTVAAIYGRPLADEIAAARVVVTLEVPRPITAIQGGTFQGRRARFDIALTDLLVLEQALRYEISW